MKRESVAFLTGGFVFGILFGFALFYALENPPELPPGQAPGSAMDGTRGPNAPTQLGGSAAGGGAPMMARINQLKRGLEQDPTDINASIELADIYQRAGMWAEAAGFYEQALESHPDHPQLLVNVGLCYRGLERYEDALAVFDQAHESEPGNWQSLFNTVIVAAVDLGQFDRANLALEAMEAIQPRPEGLEPAHLEELREWLATAQAGTEGEGQS